MDRKILIIIGIVVFIGITSWFISGYFVETDTTSNFDNFAKCLTEKGATVYVSKYCGHCKRQKEMFGDSLRYINQVECTENPDLCRQMGITGVPTWIINGVSHTGVQSFESLSSITGCPVE